MSATILSLEEILAGSGGRVVNAPSDSLLVTLSIRRLSGLRGATSGDLCFFFSRDYESDIPRALPGVLVTGELFVEPLRSSGALLWTKSVVVACPDPYLAMARLSRRFAEVQGDLEPGLPNGGVHPTAVIHSQARVAASAWIGPNCVIERGASIGENTRLVSGVYVGEEVSIGAGGLIFSNVSIYRRTRIGDRVRLHSGAVIGSDGFGYAPVREGGKVVGHEKIHHLGAVVIGNDVEIGACSAVDRGTLEDTQIEDEVKIDNLVQVGHNSVLKRGAVLCGMSGVAGSSVVGRFAYLGGRAIVINKAEVGDGALLGADCVVTKDVQAGEQVAGSPHRPLRDYLKIQAILGRMLKAPKKKGAGE